MKVSIVTPTWQRELSIIKRCISCVDAQTYTDWEHIICSDGPREARVKHLCEDNPKRRYFSESINYNDYGSSVRNNLIKSSKLEGELVCFFDDDNIILPTYLEKMVNALVNAKDGEKFAICQIMHFGPLPHHLCPAPAIITGIPPRMQNIDTLQVLTTLEAIKPFGWVKGATSGYCDDGCTYEALAKHNRFVEVPECLGIHL